MVSGFMVHPAHCEYYRIEMTSLSVSKCDLLSSWNHEHIKSLINAYYTVLFIKQKLKKKNLMYMTYNS